ncbi:MAG: alpha-glucuronidase [Burkholderiaceae bacterium]|nr:alpha-glucuronidase [Burkholderiaceae bacterium]
MPWLLLAMLLTMLLAMLPATAAPKPASVPDEDGYALWLRYAPLQGAARAQLQDQARAIVRLAPSSPTVEVALAELRRGLSGLLGQAPATVHAPRHGALVLARGADLPQAVRDSPALAAALAAAGSEGYVLRRIRLQGKQVFLVAANTDAGLLYGSFAWLRAAGTGAPLASASTPRLALRVLNHWDNPDRHVERGYAGQSIWDWWALPDLIDARYTDYARANASLGINGTVLNNVNAKADMLTPAFIAKAATLAKVFRPYGIRVYLSVRFSTPLELKETASADPLDPAVRAWWRRKANELYQAIPDFGGFLVKANSEGQPGPQDYQRSHVDGANMLAEALAPHHGAVMWRAFVYAPGGSKTDDRAKQAYDEFSPLDGQFAPNVLVQVKNGAIDFQPREPFHPLFGAMPGTPLMMEFQITKEYLGFSTDLAYLAPLFRETLSSDTHRAAPPGRRHTVADVLEQAPGRLSGMAGVANIGTDRNWSGSHFDQANWYAFGRLAWDPRADARALADEWVAQTFSRETRVRDAVSTMMMDSREAVVDYMTPLGLHHMMGSGHHHGPAPWVDNLERPDWNPVYYHRAASDGIGFDRSATGSNAIAQYAPGLARLLADPRTTPEQQLLWFHHLPWDYRMASGRTLWHELIGHYDRGVDAVKAMQAQWAALAPDIDRRRHQETAARLQRQLDNAQLWRDACIAYFQSVSGLPLPAGVTPPRYGLDTYRQLRFPYAPGNG